MTIDFFNGTIDPNNFTGAGSMLELLKRAQDLVEPVFGKPHSAAAWYHRGDRAIYQGKTYICLKDYNQGAFSSENWAEWRGFSANRGSNLVKHPSFSPQEGTKNPSNISPSEFLPRSERGVTLAYEAGISVTRLHTVLHNDNTNTPGISSDVIQLLAAMGLSQDVGGNQVVYFRGVPFAIYQITNNSGVEKRSMGEIQDANYFQANLTRACWVKVLSTGGGQIYVNDSPVTLQTGQWHYVVDYRETYAGQSAAYPLELPGGPPGADFLYCLPEAYRGDYRAALRLNPSKGPVI